MPLAAGTRLGPYEIVSPLGAGGMGEVYRALDTRLDRTVAIKILPSHLSENPEAKQRFDREARTISSLNHPNICTLHDVGHQDGMDYLVMECLEGETLADRLRKGPMPLPQLLKTAIEICDGLERAHRSGVIHRDLKPGNIMLTKTGAKLMDFGLAKAAVVSVDSSSGMTQTMIAPETSAAANHPLTAQGSVIGTFNYMAPEQVEGKEAGPRSDIFSLGAVLYEMATGKRAFEGKTAVSAMAAVMEREPAPISSLQPSLPAAFDRLVSSCLAKDPDDRWQTVHDVKLQLKQIAEGGSQAGSQFTGMAPALAKRRRWNGMGWIAAALLAVLALAAMSFAWMAQHKPLPMLRVELNPPPKTVFNLVGDDSGPAVLSPDGRNIVFSGSANGTTQLYIRPLDSLTARPLPGTATASFPFWSPDGRSVAFFLQDRLMRIEIDGGTPITICQATLGRGGSWGPDGTIVAALRYNAGISRVSAGGGAPSEITHIDNVTYSSHRWPWMLPDGKHFLYIAVNHDAPTGPQTGIFFASLDGKENRMLLPTLGSAVFAQGRLLYMHDASLVAQPFDPGQGKFTGDAEVLTEKVQYDSALWRTNLSASSNGMLLYSSTASTGTQKIAWYDRSGKLLETIGEPAELKGMSLSPDLKKLAVVEDAASSNIVLYDLATKQKTRLTYTPGVHIGPAWAPDSNRVAYITRQGANISVAPIGNSEQEQVVLRTDNQVLSTASSWSPDGRFLLYQEGSGLALRIWVLPMFGDRKPYLYTQGQGSPQEWSPKFSPDGRWVTYTSTDQGVPLVFVAPFPWTGAKWQISTGPGNQSSWRPDGKEIFYYNYSGITAVPVDGSGSQFQVGAGQQIFPLTLRGVYEDFAAADRDGQKFIAITDNETEAQPLTLVQNWTAELKGK